MADELSELAAGYHTMDMIEPAELRNYLDRIIPHV